MIRGIYPFSDEVKPHIKKVELLDFYEYTGVKLIESSGTADEIFNERMNTLREIVPHYAETIQTQYKTLEFNFYQSLPQIYDEEVVPYLPDNCLISQVAIQKKTNVIVDNYLYSKLDEVNKAGLKFHEALYRLALLRDHKTSYLVRMLNNKLFRDSLASADQFQIYEYFVRSNLQIHILVSGGDFTYNRDLSREKLTILSDLSTPRMTVPKGSQILFVLGHDKHKFGLLNDAEYSYGVNTTIIPKGSHVTFKRVDGELIVESMYLSRPIAIGNFLVSEVISIKENGQFEKVKLAQKVDFDEFYINNAEVTLNDDLMIEEASHIFLKDFKTDHFESPWDGRIHNDQGLCFSAFLENSRLKECTFQNHGFSKIHRVCHFDSCATLGYPSALRDRGMETQLSFATSLKMVKDSSGYTFSFGNDGLAINLRGFDFTLHRLRNKDICKTGRMSVMKNAFVCVK